jgi:HPt (histidine-containing phosphotransfer) domain-containing protein/two-component sensor histidine kinase
MKFKPLIQNLLNSGIAEGELGVEDTRRLTMINAMSYFATFVLLLVAVASAIAWSMGMIKDEIGLSMVVENPIIAVFFIFVIFHLRKTKNIEFASYYFSIISTIACSYFFFVPDLKTLGTWYAFLVPMGYFFFLGRRNGAISSIIYAVVVYFLFDWAAEVSKSFIPEYRRTFDAEFRFYFYIIYSAVGVFAYVFENARFKTQRKLEESNDVLSHRTHELQAAKKETDDILATVREGLFLTSPEMKIGNQYSKELLNIFATEEPNGKALTELIEGKVSAKVYRDVLNYFELLRRSEIDEEALVDLNPLHEAEFRFNNPGDMRKTLKYLSFEFNRIFTNGNITSIFCSLKDVTDRVVLEKELRIKEAQSKQQVELLMSVLQVEPVMLSDFIESCEKDMLYIDTELKKELDVNTYLPMINDVFRAMHNIKGNAGLIDQTQIAEKAHQFETALNGLKENPQLTAEDFAPLFEIYDELNGIFKEMKTIINKVNKFQISLQDRRVTLAKMLVRSLNGYVQNLAKEHGKKIEFQHSDFDPERIPLEYTTVVRDALIQLIRNSVFHGLESAEERTKAGKPEAGNIAIKTIFEKDAISLILRDDGRGLDPDKLRQKAIAGKFGGSADIAQWPDDKVHLLIFESGFSTADSVKMAGGRGVGMNVVKDEIEKKGGSIHIDSAKGQYFELRIKLPALPRSS